MATPVGTNEITSISRRYILPVLVDNIYNGNPIFFRLNAMGKKMVQGGYQIEIPLVWTRWANGGFYQGYDLLDVSPSDTVKNAAWDWKQAYVAITVSGLDLIRADSPEAIANFLTFQFENAQTELAEIMGAGIWGTGTGKNIDGIQNAVDDGTGTNGATYGGLSRSTNTFWKSTVDSSTTTLTLASMRSNFGLATQGGRHPTLICMTQANYNRYWGLTQPNQSFPVQPSGTDEQLAQAGFTSLVFDGVPVIVDSHVPANSIYFLNEDYMYFIVNPRADFSLRDFEIPANQDAMTSKILWAGDLVFSNVARQAKMTAVTAP